MHPRHECTGWVPAPLALAETYDRANRPKEAEAVRASHDGTGRLVMIPCEEHHPKLYASWRGGHLAPDHDRGRCADCLEASGQLVRRGRRRLGGRRREVPSSPPPPAQQGFVDEDF